MYYKASENFSLTFVASLSAIVWLCVSFLLGFQLSRVYRNCTANEQFKRETLASGAKSPSALKSPKSSAPVHLDPTWGGLFSFDSIEEDSSYTMEDLDFNPYNKGLKYNLHDAFVFNYSAKEKDL